MADQQLPNTGLRWFDKHANAPDFVKGTVVITLDDLVAYCKANPGELSDYQGKRQLRLQVLTSKNGNTYMKVDTFKKDAATPEPKKEESSDLPWDQ